MSAVPAFRPESSQGTEDSGLIGLSLRGLPLPATIRLANPLSDEDLLAFCQANRGLEIGSEADGSIVIMTPAAPESSELTQFLATELSLWARQLDNGVVFGPDLGIRFPDSVMRGPDVAWLSIDRWNSYKQLGSRRPAFLPFCPEFIVELRSRTDRVSMTEEKMEFWMSRGAQLGWLIDPLRKVAMIYRPGKEPETLLQPEILHGEAPITGFTLKMQRLRE